MTIASFVPFEDENKSKSRDDESLMDGRLLHLLSRLQSRCVKPRIYFCRSCTSLPQFPARSSQSCLCGVLLNHPSNFTSLLLFLQSFFICSFHQKYTHMNTLYSLYHSLQSLLTPTFALASCSPSLENCLPSS